MRLEYSNTMLDLLSVGAIKLDIFVPVPKATIIGDPHGTEAKMAIDYGKKTPVRAPFVTQIAGSAPNVAVGLAKMRLKTGVVSIMGEGLIYREALDFLKQHRVDTRNVKKQPGTRSSSAVVLNYKGESTQLVDHAPQIYRLPSSARAKFLHISELGEGYEALFADAIKLAKRTKTKISFNPGSIQIEERKDIFFKLLKVTNVLFLNMAEAKKVLGSPKTQSLVDLMRDLKALGSTLVVVTDGKKGAYAFDGKRLVYVPMFPGPRVEATGAGDAFSIGFLGALLKGKSAGEGLRWGAVNSASVVGQIGPTAGLLSSVEIKSRLKARATYKVKIIN